jgi:hypothetical protein
MDPEEPWFNKDMIQFLCELLVLRDVSTCPHDLVASLIQVPLAYLK